MQKITPEFCKDNILLFYPKTEDEAKKIQEHIFALGFEWRSLWGRTYGKFSKALDVCVREGMVLGRGALWTSPAAESKRNGIVLTLHDLEKGEMPPPTTTELYNFLSRRLDAIEERFDAIEERLAALEGQPVTRREVVATPITFKRGAGK